MSDEKQSSSKRVLVTGASGFIAGHTIIQLLDAGYIVRGTVRDAKRSEAVLALSQHAPSARHPTIELVEAELNSDAGWADAMRDVDYVMHMASPFIVHIPKDEQEIIKPAVDGTLHVLRAVANTHGQIKRVVLTSSVVAIGYGYPKSTYANKVFTEADWSNVAGCDPYPKSKTLAEKAAWDFIATLPDSDKFELTAINPGYVQGPVLNKKGCTSQDLVQRILAGEMPAVPALSFAVVDVRDVARAHILGMTTPAAANKRYICSACSMWLYDICVVLKQKYPQYKISTMKVPRFILSIVQYFDKGVRAIIGDVDKDLRMDNSAIIRDLGMTFRTGPDSICDMAQSLIDLGIVANKLSKQNVQPTKTTPSTTTTTTTTTSTTTSADMKTTTAPATATSTETTTTETNSTPAATQS